MDARNIAFIKKIIDVMYHSYEHSADIRIKAISETPAGGLIRWDDTQKGMYETEIRRYAALKTPPPNPRRPPSSAPGGAGAAAAAAGPYMPSGPEHALYAMFKMANEMGIDFVYVDDVVSRVWEPATGGGGDDEEDAGSATPSRRSSNANTADRKEEEDDIVAPDAAAAGGGGSGPGVSDLTSRLAALRADGGGGGGSASSGALAGFGAIGGGAGAASGGAGAAPVPDNFPPLAIRLFEKNARLATDYVNPKLEEVRPGTASLINKIIYNNKSNSGEAPEQYKSSERKKAANILERILGGYLVPGTGRLNTTKITNVPASAETAVENYIKNAIVLLTHIQSLRGGSRRTRRRHYKTHRSTKTRRQH